MRNFWQRHALTPLPPTLESSLLQPVDKMQTDINKRKTTLDTVQDRVRELLSGRAAIEEAISSLETLQQLSSPAIINHDALHDIPSLQQRLDKIQDLLRPLIPEVQRQTEQIDSYLDTYEELMKLAEDLGREE